jgi:transcriptional regulator with XRE-family HTH domain
MTKRGNTEALRLTVGTLRQHAGMTQEEFGRASRVDQSDVSRYELKKPVPEESLRRMAAAVRLPWTAMVHLRRFFTAFLSAATHRSAAVNEEDAVAELAGLVQDTALLVVLPYLLAAPLGRRPHSPEVARREAAEAWAALERLPLPERRRFLALAPRAARTPAFVARICEASVQAASDGVEIARELADLALSLARRLPGKSLRLRAEAFCLAFLANVLRVATDFAEADRAFARAWELWRAGEPCEPELFPEWRLFDLEASLRRAQHRFADALECLDRALAASGTDPLVAGRLSIKKANVLEQWGDHAGALAVLEKATPTIEAAQDPHLLLRLRFNTAVNLVYLERFAEAAALLPETMELARTQDRKLDGTRVAWLVAKVDAGRGRVKEARAGLERVSQDFTTQELPYEAALASLDLAVLDLKEGRTAEVKRLAVAMNWIFEAKGIDREALAALALFCEAAKQEAATVELARRVIREVEKAQRS